MSIRYDHDQVERKWQARWEEAHCFEAKEDHTLPKFYPLIEFPYPSGAGLHVGHPRSNTALDIIARKRRMEGYNVLYPIGYDAFGLPTENYAIKTGEHPAKVTAQNIQRFRSQLKRLGFSFDWSREVNTTDPNYYKWTQWIFLKLYEKGLAYKAEIPINFCTSCKVGLANEEVVEGVCERCGGPVIQKIRKAGADGIIFGGYHPEASKLVQQLAKKKIDIPFIGPDGVKDEQFIKVAGKNAEGVYATGPTDVSKLPMNIQAHENHKKKYGTEPGAFYDNAYSATVALLEAIKAAGSTDSQKIMEALRTNMVDTPLGKIKFDAKGDAEGIGFSIYEVKDGKFVELK